MSRAADLRALAGTVRDLEAPSPDVDIAVARVLDHPGDRPPADAVMDGRDPETGDVCWRSAEIMLSDTVEVDGNIETIVFPTIGTTRRWTGSIDAVVSKIGPGLSWTAIGRSSGDSFANVWIETGTMVGATRGPWNVPPGRRPVACSLLAALLMQIADEEGAVP